MARWIRDGASAYDAAVVLRPTPPPQPGATFAPPALGGLRELILKAKLFNTAAAAALEQELLSLGAVHVSEVGRSEWETLSSWGLLRLFEQRRLLAAV